MVYLASSSHVAGAVIRSMGLACPGRGRRDATSGPLTEASERTAPSLVGVLIGLTLRTGRRPNQATV